MAVRVSSLIILFVIVGAVGFLVLTFGGWLAIGWFNAQTFDDGVAVAKGYTAAKTPQEAMDKFYKAIQARDYKDAGRYTTKSYADMLKRAHTNASNLGTDIDKIRDYAKEKGILSDKLHQIFFMLDPFPKNFKVGPAPKEESDKKTYSSFIWEPLVFKNPTTPVKLDDDMKDLDRQMYQNVLCWNQVFVGKILLVKEGEEWKLDVPTVPAWEVAVSVFIDKSKSYHTALDNFRLNMTNDRYGTAVAFDADVLQKLRDCK